MPGAFVSTAQSTIDYIWTLRGGGVYRDLSVQEHAWTRTWCGFREGKGVTMGLEDAR